MTEEQIENLARVAQELGEIAQEIAEKICEVFKQLEISISNFMKSFFGNKSVKSILKMLSRQNKSAPISAGRVRSLLKHIPESVRLKYST